MQYQKLAAHFIHMAQQDQQAQEGRQDMLAIDQTHAEEMKHIIAEIGWPTIPKVGEEASHAAWLLVQHADHDVAFQTACLELMKESLDGEVKNEDIAYLEDRIRVNEGQPQLYGTQWFVSEEGVFQPEPIEDEDWLDERRKVVGMEPFDVYRKAMMEMYKNM